MEEKERYKWDKIEESYEWIRDTETVNQPLYYDLETVASLLNQQDQRIKELEAKLAESEKQRQHLKDWLDNELLTSVDNESYYATINEYEEEVKKLKQQLAEKEKII